MPAVCTCMPKLILILRTEVPSFTALSAHGIGSTEFCPKDYFLYANCATQYL